MAENAVKQNFNIKSLSENDTKDFLFVQKRIVELKQTRTDHYGVNLDKLWAEADRAYIPHRLASKTKRAGVADEDKGWRSAPIVLGSNDWRSDVSQANPFIKIQTALSILIDQNPTGVFTATTKRYKATNELIKQLYQRSWDVAKSKSQLKLFVFNLAKYGWAVARTYPLKITRNVKVVNELDVDNPSKTTYKSKEIVEFNDIMRENLDPRNVWIDDMAKPSNPFSVKDWCWRKIYDMDVAKEEFSKYSNWQFVQPGGITDETVSSGNISGLSIGKTYKSSNLVEIYFYENRIKDLFVVIANGIPVIIEPLPIADAKGIKKLSLWQAPWNLRHAESPYGLGIYEVMRFDQGLLDRIRNMTIDQLTLAIYKMWFYQGTQSLTETGDIQITPGVGKQILDPKNISWLEVPGPGAEAWKGIDQFKKDVDEVSGIGDPLLGQITGKTAFEIAQAKEAALKRLKSPLENILEALNIEGYITVALIQILYSIPETYRITEPGLIEAYLKEIQSDPSLYDRDEFGNFTAKVYQEFPLNLERDQKDNLVESKDTQFFRIKPQYLQWEGIINIRAQSLLTPSKQLDKALELEMWDRLIPLFTFPPQLYSKAAKSIVELYEKDPNDILPDSWLQDTGSQMTQQAEQPLIIPAEQGVSANLPPGQGPINKLPTPAGVEVPTERPGIISKLINHLTSPFRKV